MLQEFKAVRWVLTLLWKAEYYMLPYIVKATLLV